MSDKRKAAIEAMARGIVKARGGDLGTWNKLLAQFPSARVTQAVLLDATAALDALLAALPGLGLRVVPVEPDEAMKQKIHFADWHGKSDLDWSDGYRIMTASAPNVLGETP